MLSTDPERVCLKMLGFQESNPPADEFVSLPVSDISNTNLGTVKKILGNHGGDAAIKTEEPLFQVEDDSSEQEASDSNQYLKPPSRPSPESSESDWETFSTLEDSSLERILRTGGVRTDKLISKGLSLPLDSPPITVQPQANTSQVVLIIVGPDFWLGGGPVWYASGHLHKGKS